MNIQAALATGRALLQATSPTPAVDARLLLQYLLQRPHSYLVAHGDATLAAAQLAAYRRLLARAQRREPIPYITGTAPFDGLDFAVTPAVLIPRPETELLVAAAARLAGRRSGGARLVDVGTGSGCVAVALARRLPRAVVTAVDVSAAALAVARANAARHAPGRVHFWQGRLLTAVAGPFDLIAANLPYVTGAEWTGLDDSVKWYEPAVALQGGRDGLDLIRELLPQAAARLRPGGAIVLEIGWRQGPVAGDLARHVFPAAQIQILPDEAGHQRLVVIQDNAP